MKKINYIVFALILMVFIGLQTVEPTSAAKPKLIDHGNQVYSVIGGSFAWKTYQYNSKYIVIKTKRYDDTGKLRYTAKATMKKTSKNRIKMVIITKYISDPGTSYYEKITRYIKSSLTVKKYYFTKVKNIDEWIFPYDD